MDERFSVFTVSDYLVIFFDTSTLMNAAELGLIGQALYNTVDEQCKGKLVLDFTQVEYLSSQAIGIIVNLHKKISAMPGGKMVLCGVNPQLMQLLKITRLDRLLKIAKTQRDAVS